MVAVRKVEAEETLPSKTCDQERPWTIIQGLSCYWGRRDPLQTRSLWALADLDLMDADESYPAPALAVPAFLLVFHVVCQAQGHVVV